jgi:hypothetical protein
MTGRRARMLRLLAVAAADLRLGPAMARRSGWPAGIDSALLPAPPAPATARWLQKRGPLPPPAPPCNPPPSQVLKLELEAGGLPSYLCAPRQCTIRKYMRKEEDGVYTIMFEWVAQRGRGPGAGAGGRGARGGGAGAGVRCWLPRVCVH